jgi:hypothetical protein
LKPMPGCGEGVVVVDMLVFRRTPWRRRARDA